MRREFDFDFARFNREMDMESIAKELNNASNGNWKKVPYDKYDVVITELYFKPSQTGKAMMTTVFEIQAGEHKGEQIWYNQLLDTKVRIGVAKSFIMSLDVFEPSDVKLTSDLDDMVNLISDVEDAVLEEHRHYCLDFYQNAKGFDAYRIETI